MASPYKRVTNEHFKALWVEAWEQEKASAPKCSRDQTKYGIAKWTAWCAREHYDPDDTSEAQIAMFAKYFAEECDPAYNSFRNIFPALAQHRKDLAVRGKVVPEGRPSQNPVVRSLKKVVGRRQQKELHESGQLNARNERQMTPEHYEKAMQICLTLFGGQKALLLRAMVSLQVTMAARSVDTRRIRTANIAQKHYALLTPGATSLRGGALGPDPAHATIFNSALDKGSKPGRIANRSIVRAADVEYCAESAVTDVLRFDLSQPGRLHVKTILEGHLLRWPNTSGKRELAATTLGPAYKKMMTAAGMPCNMKVGRHSKNRSTHGAKGLSIEDLLDQPGMVFSDVQRAAGHSHSVTQDSYMLTSERNTMFRRAGFGEQWQTCHYLGRASVTPTAALQELVLPGLSQLVASPSLDLQRTFLLHRPTVFLQDAPLKLRALGSAWADLFPQLKAITAHPDWPPFEAEVLARHEEGERLLGNSLRCSASGPEALAGLQRESEQMQQAQQAQADSQAQLARAMKDLKDNLPRKVQATIFGALEQYQNPLKRVLDSDLSLPQQASAKRVCSDPSTTPPPPERGTPPEATEPAEAAPATPSDDFGAAISGSLAGLTFRMQDFADVRAAWEVFYTIKSTTVKGKRHWLWRP